MGLTSWKGDVVRKQDVTISKNYLKKEELDTLNRIVTMYLDYAELQAKNHRQMFTKDWREKLDAFLQFNDQEILKDSGKIEKEVADKLAIEKFETFRQKRLEENANQPGDIDDAIKNLKE